MPAPESGPSNTGGTLFRQFTESLLWRPLPLTRQPSQVKTTSELQKRKLRKQGAQAGRDFRRNAILATLNNCGEVQFKNNYGNARARENAKFALLPVVASQESAGEPQTETQAEDICALLDEIWELPPPSALLSVTGSAQDMSLEPQLEKIFQEGLAAASRATDAWVVSGGMDAGVMALVGKALAGSNNKTPCIGIAPWRKVTHREVFEKGHLTGHSNPVSYFKRKPNSHNSSALDVNHTHFLLVDDEREQYGGEISTRASVEASIAKRYTIPTVLLVVQGGPGTFSTVEASMKMSTRVLLVRDTRGCAKVISDYVEPLIESKAWQLQGKDLEDRLKERDEEFREHLQDLYQPEQVEKIAQQLHDIGTRLDYISIFSIKSLGEVRACMPDHDAHSLGASPSGAAA